MPKNNFYAQQQEKRKEIKQRKLGTDAQEKQAPQKLQMWNSEFSEEDIHEMVNRVQAQIRNDQIIKKGQLMDRPEEGKTMRQ